MGQAKILKNGLTMKQNAFTKKILEQIAETGKPDATAAIMEVYDVKSKSTAKSMGAENLAKPLIKQTLEEALSSAGVEASTIMGNIARISQEIPEKLTGDTVLKANIELLKLIGAYPDNKKEGVTVNISQNVNNLSFTEAKEQFHAIDNEASTFFTDAEIELPT